MQVNDTVIVPGGDVNPSLSYHHEVVLPFWHDALTLVPGIWGVFKLTPLTPDASLTVAEYVNVPPAATVEDDDTFENVGPAVSPPELLVMVMVRSLERE